MRQRLGRTTVIDYQVERHNSNWADHDARAKVTGALVAWLRPSTVLDPACGDGAIALEAVKLAAFKATMGDISTPNIERLRADTPRFDDYWTFVVGDVLETITGSGDFDACVLTEILEHVEDPDTILRAAKVVSSYLVASSPVMRHGQVDTNPEHLWMFDRDGYEEMLLDAGWNVLTFVKMDFHAFQYDFGIWVCG